MARGGGASPLTLALQAQQHAEHLQRQHATRAQVGLPEPPLDPAARQAVDAHIDAMPGLSDHKRRFLKSHPSLLQAPFLQLMQHAYMVARSANIPDDSAAMDAAVLSGIHRDLEHHRQLSALTSAQARPTPENHQAHQDAAEAAADLQREAEMHLGEYQPAPTAPSPQPRPQRKGFPMAAPVFRDSPSALGQRNESNHLSRDEREIARVSFPHLPAARAEYEYLQNKRLMIQRKANGEIQGDR